LTFAKWGKEQTLEKEKANASAVDGSTKSVQRDSVFQSEYAAAVATKLRRVNLMNIRLAALQDKYRDLQQKEDKLLQAVTQSEAMTRKYVFNEVTEEVVEDSEEEDLALPDLEETPEEREARLNDIRSQIDDLNVEIESLPAHLRAEPTLQRDELEVTLMREMIPTMEEGSEELIDAKRKMALFDLKNLEEMYAKQDTWGKLVLEGKLEAMRKAVHPEDFPDIPETAEISMLLTMKFDTMQATYRVPSELTFQQLMKSATSYFDCDMSKQYCIVLEDSSTGVGSLQIEDRQVGSQPVLTALNNNKLLGHRQMSPEIPTLWLIEKEDQVIEGKSVWSGSAHDTLIPQQAPLSTEERAVLSLQKKTRQKARYSCMLYSGFLFVLCVIIMGWIPTHDAYIMRRGMHTNLFEEDFSEDISHFQKGFADIASDGEMYDWLNDIFIGALGLGDGGVIADNTRLIGGIRFRQHRVGTGEEYDCKIPKFAGNWTVAQNVLCYPEFDDSQSMSTESFGPCGSMGVLSAGMGSNPDGSFKKVTGLGPCDIPPSTGGYGGGIDTSGMPTTPQRWQYVEESYGINLRTDDGPDGGYPAGGFALYIAADEDILTAAIAEMQAEGWIDAQTRVNIVEILTYNPNVNVFIQVRVIFEFDPTGLCVPSVQYSPMVLDKPIDLLYYLCSMIYIVYIVYFYSIYCDDLRRAKLELGSYGAFFLEGWNLLDTIIYGLCVVYQILSLVYLLSPSRRNFNPASQYYQDLNGLAQISTTIQNIHAVIVVLSFMKLFKYLNLSDQFALMSDTVINVTTDIFVFNVMLMVVMASFAVSGNQLFGSEVADYSSLTETLNTMFRVMLGDFDFEELINVSFFYAVVWFILFQVLVFMIMLNVFISIIAESFCAEHSIARASLGQEMSSLTNSMYKGVAYRIKPLPDNNEGLPKPFFDPVVDDLVRDRTVESGDKERKESFGGYSWAGAWASYRGLPTDSATITSRIRHPPKKDSKSSKEQKLLAIG